MRGRGFESRRSRFRPPPFAPALVRELIRGLGVAEEWRGRSDHDPSVSSSASRGGEDRRLHLTEGCVAEVVLEPGVPGRCLTRVDLERKLTKILGAVDAREQNDGLPPRVAETRARELGVEAPRRIAFGQVACEAGNAVVADHMPCGELAGDDARAAENDPPDRHRLPGG